jgi:competence protein ComGC
MQNEPKKAEKISLIASMVLTTVIAVPLLLAIPGLQKARARAQRIGCVCNEKQLGIAFRGFGVDVGAFPMRATNNASQLQN